MTPPTDSLLLSKTGVFLRCWEEALLAIRRPAPWLGLLPLVVAQGVVLAALTAFPHAPWGAFWEPLLRIAGGSSALHYPESWAILPTVQAWVDRGVLFLAGSLSFALIVGALPGVFLGRTMPESGFPGKGFERWPAVLGASLPILLGAGGASVAVDLVPGGGFGPIPLDTAFEMTFRGLDLALRVLLAYGVAAAVLGGDGPVAAVRRGIAFASRHFWTTTGFVVLTGIPELAVRKLRGDPQARFQADDPESMAVWMGVEILLSTLGHLVLVILTTRLWLHWEGVPAGAASTGNGR